MTKTLLLNILMSMICLTVGAQIDIADTSNKSSFSYYFNPGISFGLGGARPRGYIPQVTLKLGRVELGVTPPVNFKNTIITSGQLDIDLWKFTGLKDKRAYATIGIGGYIKESKQSHIRGWTEGVSFLAGVNQSVGKRSQFSAKMGTLGTYSYNWEAYNSSFIRESIKWYPYGEICYKLYVFPFSEKKKKLKQMLYNENVKFEKRLGQLDSFELNYTLYKKNLRGIRPPKQKISWITFFSNNLNPGLSLGIGDGRNNLVLPSVQLKVWRFNVKGMQYQYDDIMYKALQVEIDLLKINKKDSSHQHYITSSFGAHERYTRWYRAEQFASTGGSCLLFGLNRYTAGKRLKLSGKLGVSIFNYAGADAGFCGELSANYYLLPFDSFKTLSLSKLISRRNKKRAFKENIPALYPNFSKFFNPRISIGGGVTHAAFFGPTLGVKIWRLDVGMGFAHIGGEPWISINGDVELFKINKNPKKWLTIGISGMGSYENVSSVHFGYKKYNKRSAWSFKGGVGKVDYYESDRVRFFPSLDASYHLYLCRFE